MVLAPAGGSGPQERRLLEAELLGGRGGGGGHRNQGQKIAGPRVEVTRDNRSPLDPSYGIYIYNCNPTLFFCLLAIVYFLPPKLDCSLLKGGDQVCSV